MKEAPIYDKLSESKTQCGICPRSCVLSLNQRGYCGLYINVNGKLVYRAIRRRNRLFSEQLRKLFFHPRTTSFN